MGVEKIVLFDGDCQFCEASVSFIIKHEQKDSLKFCSLRSEKASDLLKKDSFNIDRLIFIEGEKCYTKSSAALHICRYLTYPWKLLSLLLIIPKPIRDFLYTLIAKNRYKLGPFSQSCPLPTEEIRKKFLLK